jgi:HD domain
MASIVDYAEAVAFDLLADSLPRRWAHTVGVAAAADRFARTLAPHCAERVVAAAWLHDIGYAPDLVAAGFHPIDGAAYVARSRSSVLSDVVGLIAHHTGAAFEAAERGLENELARYRFPVDVEELALLNAADLCTSPDGVFLDPQAMLTEVLDRYPPDNPHINIPMEKTLGSLLKSGSQRTICTFRRLRRWQSISRDSSLG